MVSDITSNIISFNGDIYNYVELVRLMVTCVNLCLLILKYCCVHLFANGVEKHMLPNLAVITLFGKLCLFREYFGCDWKPKGDLCFPIEYSIGILYVYVKNIKK